MPESVLTIETVTAENFAALGSLRRLWREYAEHLETVLGPEYVCLKDYEKEFAQLPGEYSPPNGALLLGLVQGDPAGSVGLRRILLADSTPAAEIRHIWVRPQFRGHGIARSLIRAAVDSACAAGYDSVYLDSTVEKMREAVSLYRSEGFVECPRYNQNRIPGIHFFRKSLRNELAR